MGPQLLIGFVQYINVRIAQMSDVELELEYRRLIADDLKSMTAEERREFLQQLPLEGEYSEIEQS